MAFLQSFLRIKKIECVLELAMHGFVTRHLRAIEASSQPVDLIIDLAPSFIERVGQGGIGSPQLILRPIQLVVEGSGCMFDSLGSLRAQILFYKACHYIISTLTEIDRTRT